MDRFADPSRPLSLPPHPSPPRRPGFPLLAILAPVAAAGLLFAITRSPLSLAFAAIGPIVGVASVLDGIRSARRERRRAARERDAAIAVLRSEIAARHGQERERAWRTTPSMDRLAAEPAGSRWLDLGGAPVVLGSGAEPSSLRLEGDPFDDRDRELVLSAGSLSDAPVLVGLDGGIGFVGPELLARAAARAVVARCALTGLPGSVRIQAPSGPHWDWVELLPHRAGERGVTVVESDGGGVGPSRSAGAIVAVARDRGELPPGLATVVHLETARRAIIEQPGDPRGGRECVPELLGERQARELAVRLGEVAARNALGGSTDLPARVELAALPQPSERGRDTLAVAVGVAVGGPLRVDLVRDGPHALVGGTTGSGKSEFLLAWLAALAAAFGPDELGVLLVDFKGGAAFQPIARLPHVTGIVTDLDDGEALRAVQSLRAESRRRERVLREHGVRDIAELDASIPLARLVIVIDEYQALIERFAELGEVIADIAARGRSLGLHLILATQRPNGVVREQISANCRLRVCLRVLQAGDSRAVVGVGDAAEIAPERPGRAVLDRGDGSPTAFQSAIADPMHLELVHAAHAGSPPAARPWLDPLPARLALEALPHAGDAPDGAIVFGLLDDPAAQRRSPAAWLPEVEGPLLVAGVPGSGRTTVLSTVAAAFAARHGEASVRVLPERRSAAWDLLRTLSTEGARGTDPDGGRVPRLLVIDDLDRRFRGWPDEYRIAAEAMLDSLLRSARSSRWSIAASATRPTSVAAGVRDAFGALLLLRQQARSDVVQLGGDPVLWRADDRPGAGQWAGLRVQCASGGVLFERQIAETPVLAFEPGRRYALVSANPADSLARLARLPGVRTVALGAGAQAVQTAAATAGIVDPARTASAPSASEASALVLVGDAESWSGAWQLWGAIRQETAVLVHGGLGEFRALVRDRALPPLLDPADDRGWSIGADGRVGRFVWPGEACN